MSAFLSQIARVEVKGGDALPNNRTTGKSNTGTYFLCSTKEWNDFLKFIPEDKTVKYFVDLKKVHLYKKIFVASFSHLKPNYPDNMKYFNAYCDSLLSYKENPEILVITRKNDTRIFMKFDNSFETEIINYLKNILYADLSQIVLELVNENTCMVYPIVNSDKVDYMIGE